MDGPILRERFPKKSEWKIAKIILYSDTCKLMTLSLDKHSSGKGFW